MKTARVITTVLASLTAFLFVASFALAQQTQAHVMQNPASASWGAAPPMLPSGAEIAVLSGNPMQATPYDSPEISGQLRYRTPFPSGR
jgi:hypothetical protein